MFVKDNPVQACTENKHHAERREAADKIIGPELVDATNYAPAGIPPINDKTYLVQNNLNVLAFGS